jgi:hypothetical protein
MKGNILAVYVIWAFVMITLILGCLYAPGSKFMVRAFPYKIHFVFCIALPGLLVMLWWGIALLRGTLLQHNSDENQGRTLCGLVFYCLTIILLTGGVAVSPLTSLVAIVPLLSAPFMALPQRKRTFYAYAVGVFAVSFLSAMEPFSPPASYPQGWASSGQFNTWIVMLTLLLSIMIEVGFINWQVEGLPAS